MSIEETFERIEKQNADFAKRLEIAGRNGLTFEIKRANGYSSFKGKWEPVELCNDIFFFNGREYKTPNDFRICQYHFEGLI